MKTKSPSVIKRDMKRMFLYSLKKKEEFFRKVKLLILKQMSYQTLPSIDISPKRISLSMIMLPPTSIPPTTSSSSFVNPLTKTLDAANHKYHDPRTKPRPPDLLQCTVCMKIFETRDDQRWHYENKHGREDCRLLKLMIVLVITCD